VPLIYVESEDKYRLISEFMDPIDHSIQEVGGEAFVGNMPLPPPPYMQSIVLKAMRKSGMLTMSDPKIFVALARKASEEADVEASIRLLHYICAASRFWPKPINEP